MATLDRLDPTALAGEQEPRVNALWNIALLGNRGIQPERAFDIIMHSVGDPNENVTYHGGIAWRIWYSRTRR